MNLTKAIGRSTSSVFRSSMTRERYKREFVKTIEVETIYRTYRPCTGEKKIEITVV